MSLFRPKPGSTDNHPFSNTGGPFNDSSATPSSAQPSAPTSFAPPAATKPVGPVPIAPGETTQTLAPQTPSLTPSGAQTEGTPYKASGKSAPGGVPRLLLSTVLGALIVGVVYHFVARIFDLVIIFPLIAGVAAGSFISTAVEKGRVRKPRLVMVCALCASLLVYGTKLFLNSRQARPELVAGFTEYLDSTSGVKSVPPAVHAANLQQVESILDPWTTFRAYMRLEAKIGVSIKHNGVGEGISIKGPFYWALLLAEIGFCAMGAGAFTPSRASDPYCEQTDRWLPNETILRVHPSQNATLLEKLNNRDWRGLLETPQGGAVNDKNNTDVILYSAPGSPTATLAIKSTTKGSNANVFIAPQTADGLRAICKEIDERETAELQGAVAVAGADA